VRIWVIGNAAVDESLTVEAWPAPGMSVFAANTGRDLGGKGANQALILARCGVDVGFLTLVGDDEAGAWVLATLAAEGIADLRASRTATGTDRSVILVGPAGENAIVTTVDCAASLTPDDVRAALVGATPGDALLVQGNLTLEATRAALSGARAGGLATAFNPSPIRDGFAALLPLVDLLIVNLHEARSLSGEGDPSAAAKALRRAGAGVVVVTLGGDGVLAETADGSITVPAAAAEVVDTTGAGDTFAGVLIARWTRAGVLRPADVAAAAAAAAITVGRRGTRAAFPSREELAALLAAAT
jgi:ribokinase